MTDYSWDCISQQLEQAAARVAADPKLQAAADEWRRQDAEHLREGRGYQRADGSWSHLDGPLIP